MATVAQSVSMNAHGGVRALSEGNKTQAVYTLIRDQKWEQAIRILTSELQTHAHSRAALSLLGFCYYFRQDFHAAAETYEQLCKYHPQVEVRACTPSSLHYISAEKKRVVCCACCVHVCGGLLLGGAPVCVPVSLCVSCSGLCILSCLGDNCPLAVCMLHNESLVSCCCGVCASPELSAGIHIHRSTRCIARRPCTRPLCTPRPARRLCRWRTRSTPTG